MHKKLSQQVYKAFLLHKKLPTKKFSKFHPNANPKIHTFHYNSPISHQKPTYFNYRHHFWTSQILNTYLNEDFP